MWLAHLVYQQSAWFVDFLYHVSEAGDAVGEGGCRHLVGVGDRHGPGTVRIGLNCI